MRQFLQYRNVERNVWHSDASHFHTPVFKSRETRYYARQAPRLDAENGGSEGY